MSHVEAQILNLLKRRAKRMSIVDIARQLRRSAPTVSKYVGLLEVRGKVEVDRSEPPRKFVRLSSKR
jgi:DNA-binding Lrp family transcriptional regulator